MSALQPSSPDMQAFSERLSRLRQERGWSLPYVARHVGCSSKAVTYWENGRRVPGAESLARLASLFSISMDDLWKGQA